MELFVNGVNAYYKMDFSLEKSFRKLVVSVPVAKEKIDTGDFIRDELFTRYELVYYVKDGKIVDKEIENEEKSDELLNFIEDSNEYQYYIKEKIEDFVFHAHLIDILSSVTNDEIKETTYEKLGERVYIGFYLKNKPNAPCFGIFKKDGSFFLSSYDQRMKYPQIDHLAPETLLFFKNYFLTKSKYRTRILVDGGKQE